MDSLNEYYDVSIKKEALNRLEIVSQEVVGNRVGEGPSHVTLCLTCK